MKYLLLLLLLLSSCSSPFEIELFCVDGVLYLKADNGTLIQAKLYENNKCLSAEMAEKK